MSTFQSAIAVQQPNFAVSFARLAKKTLIFS